jgi:hypothetical protein
MRRALVALALVALALTGAGCGSGGSGAPAGVPHRTWVTGVCEALHPWRDRFTALNGQAADQMKGATTPDQAKTNLVTLLGGVRQATEDARVKVAAAGAPDVADGAAIAQRFVAALAAVRDAYGKAQRTVQGLSTSDSAGFYRDVAAAMDTLNTDYKRAGLDVGKLASADLRKDFGEVPACA